MSQVVATGVQSYEAIIKNNYMYVDKTQFIKEWWENGDTVTLMTRPRRFGKTLMMDMCQCFFSNKYKDRDDLFVGKKIYQYPHYRKIQGTYPVIYLSFANIKATSFEQTRIEINKVITHLYNSYDFLIHSDCLNNNEKKDFLAIHKDMSFNDAITSLNQLSLYLEKYYGKKVIILLDEYDTPMQEAYMYGYWDEIVVFFRSLFNSTFKTNTSLERAIMTGITRVSKESIFSDLNNLKVVTTTSKDYASSFGFSEEEVFSLLDEYDLEKTKASVKQWYDGFIFGNKKGIYNPWSIINFLKEKKLSTYWANTSGNGLISHLCQTSDIEYKKQLEKLIEGQSIEVKFDEQIIFDQLDRVEGALWSLMVASGYLKIEKENIYTIEDENGMEIDRTTKYVISITNYEVKQMMTTMILQWFKNNEDYEDFLYYLIHDDIHGMNDMINELAKEMMSSFDAGNQISRRTPERFYHGFVLGLLVDLRKDYIVTSQQESGIGRYDIMIEPRDRNKEGYIFEFKVFDRHKENSLQETAARAIKQINDKGYEEKLIHRGIKNIRKYGFAFKGKDVLILKG